MYLLCLPLSNAYCCGWHAVGVQETFDEQMNETVIIKE